MFEQSADEPITGGRTSSGGQSVRDLIERVFLLGLGAAALSKDRLQEVVEELVRRGQISSDEGREMVDSLVTRSREEARSAAKKADSSLQGAYREMGLVTKREVEDLDFRLRQLEHRIQLLEAQADAGSAPAGSASQDEDPLA